MVFEPRKIIMPEFTGTKMTKVHLDREVEMYPFDIMWQQSSSRSESNVKKLDRKIVIAFIIPRSEKQLHIRTF